MASKTARMTARTCHKEIMVTCSGATGESHEHHADLSPLYGEG